MKHFQKWALEPVKVSRLFLIIVFISATIHAIEAIVEDPLSGIIVICICVFILRILFNSDTER